MGSHPNAMIATADGARLFVASANTDTVSVIDTRTDRELERIASVSATANRRRQPQALALSDNGARAVRGQRADPVGCCGVARRDVFPAETGDEGSRGTATQASQDARAAASSASFLPPRYPSALAVVGDELFRRQRQGGGNRPAECADLRVPREHELRGAYAPSLFRSSIRRVAVPDAARSRRDHDACAAARTASRARASIACSRAVADHARHLRHQGEPHLRSGVRRCAARRGRHARRRRCRRSRSSAAATRRGGRAGRRRTSRRIIARWRCDSDYSIASSSTPRPAPTGTTGRPRLSRPTTWTRRSDGATRAAAARYDFEGFNRLPDLERDGAAATGCRCRPPPRTSPPSCGGSFRT